MVLQELSLWETYNCGYKNSYDKAAFLTLLLLTQPFHIENVSDKVPKEIKFQMARSRQGGKK